MSLYDFFKNIFGLRNHNTTTDPPISDPNRGNEFKKPVWIDEYEEEDDDILSQRHGSPTFPVLSDPIEIHRYFEQQMQLMQEMMKNFSMFSPSSIFENFDDEDKTKIYGALEQPQKGPRSLRDEYLKHPESTVKSQRKDIDLDSRVGAEDLGRIMDDVAPGNHYSPPIQSPKFHFFGESVVSQTVRKPDGTVETRTTTRRSDGTEETIVSTQRGDSTEDVHTERSLIPRTGMDIFSSSGTQEDFMIDIFKSFLTRK